MSAHHPLDSNSVTGGHCPYCGEPVEVVVDPGGASTQEYVEDCPVCCRPWLVRVRWTGGVPNLELRREQE